MSKRTNIIKYTIMPQNKDDDYDSNFKLSLTEFAKTLDKALVCPLIIYNVDLDIPLDMDESIEEYLVFASHDTLHSVIKRQETTDVFRCLILHGFDVSLDEVRDFYCPLARKNEADICINTIQDIELDNNLTFYLYDDLDLISEEEWEDTKEGLSQDMKDYIDEYKNYEELDENDLLDLLPMLLGDETLPMKIKLPEDNKEKEEEKKETKSVEKEEPKYNMITCSFEYNGYIAINKLGDNLYSIEDDDYEVLLSAEQIDFIFEQYKRIKDKEI